MSRANGVSRSASAKLLDRALVAVTCLSLGGSVGYMWWNSSEKQQERRALGPLRTVVGWERFTVEGHRRGTSTAPTKLVVFVDYQCPGCRAFHDALHNLMREFEVLSIVYRHYPLTTIHPHARAAALAVECADIEGKFWELSDRLFRLQDSIGEVPWATFARSAGVTNVPEFDRCMTDSAYVNRIDRDVAAGAELGIPGTPAFLVNNQLYTGARSPNQIKDIISRLGVQATSP